MNMKRNIIVIALCVLGLLASTAQVSAGGHPPVRSGRVGHVGHPPVR
jgi:hypothetical protein